MKINSKISIIVIFVVIVLFIAIGSINNQYEPKISTISGNINELKNIDIHYNESKSIFINREYILNADKVSRNVNLIKPYPNGTKSYVSLMDVTSGEDMISHVGYEVNNEDNKKILNLVIDEKKSKGDVLIYPKEGSDKKSYDPQFDKKEIDRTKISLNKSNYGKEYNTEILASNRHKNNLYIISNNYQYMNSNIKNSLEIININTDNKSIKSSKKIDIAKIISEKYENILTNISIERIEVKGASKYKNKFFVIMEVYKYMGGNKDLGEALLLEYDLDTNSYKLEALSNYDGYTLSHIKLKDNILECVYKEESEKIAIKVVKFDMNSKTVLDEFSYVVEEHVSGRRGIRDILIDDERIYLLTTTLESFVMWDDNNTIYAINKSDRSKTYEGRLMSISPNSWTGFTER
ncbi:hypothetical protein CHL78_008685 [Romboutsia weinsteinii]|uniref:Uncharacterized protein n=1 Tax=Romboutsia weinsteinii TaxID=2020949 RepID=A0A371J427_9FIRM|nr:hypothetical protein [Romboutsia weinsteinii]RDY27532.1 hypothetical protein CHL78_008685 [Romboutsia weinsteinii]